jgi:phosphoesterase RecJ-like protein
VTIDWPVLVDTLRKAKRVLVTAHVSPDGDSIGSALAFRELLLALGVESVSIVMQDPVPLRYQWLPGVDAVTQANGRPAEVDLAVILDAAERARIGSASDAIPSEATLLVIDHHLVDHTEGDLAFVDASYAATGEILVDLFEHAEVPISQSAAICLYVALTTDTGSFRYPLTSPRSHRAAAKLLEIGIDTADISSRVFDSMSASKFRITNAALSKAEFSAEGRVAHTCVTNGDLAETGATGEELDTICNTMRNVDGVVVAVMFKETEPNVTKASLRARPGFNCAEALKPLGGGGHAGAAGITMNAPLDEARKTLVAHLTELVGAVA